MAVHLPLGAEAQAEARIRAVLEQHPQALRRAPRDHAQSGCMIIGTYYNSHLDPDPAVEVERDAEGNEILRGGGHGQTSAPTSTPLASNRFEEVLPVAGSRPSEWDHPAHLANTPPPETFPRQLHR